MAPDRPTTEARAARGHPIARRVIASLPFRLLAAAVDLRRLAAAPGGYVSFARDLSRYRKMPGAERLRLRDLTPELTHRVASSPYDPHYFFQDAWAARTIVSSSPAEHVDVGSHLALVSFLAAIVDIRPLEAELPGLRSVAGSILDLPFADRSLPSVSSLHVAEHIGLGRYGDPLEPRGTVLAAAELQRVVADGGQLLFSLPVGRPRTYFNAHRVHDPVAVAALFPELVLEEFSGVDDAGRWAEDREPRELAGERYACGCYRFARPSSKSR
jgi:hypothetical protein